MNTLITKNDLSEAAAILRRGGLVAVPTETVYGLAGNGLNAQAVEQIYEVKGRPSVKPLSLMVHGPEAMELYAYDIPESARVLAEKFWPGPLTIILKAKNCIPSIVLAGGTTVGLRCPDHPLTLELLKKADIPFAAPSANPSSLPSPKDAEKVREYFDGKIDAIIDGGPCGIGFESTIIDMSDTPYRILRQGALPAEEIENALKASLKIIGITGCTGSGKTTVLNALSSNDFLVIDCDKVYHSLLDSCEALTDAIIKEFPCCASGQGIDRKALGKAVFTNGSALKRLNEITHPFVITEAERMLREFAMNGGKYAAIDAIELFLSGLADICNLTVGVTAQKEKRAERIMLRDGISKEQAYLRIDAQKEEEYYISKCDLIIENNGTQADITEKIKNIITEEFTNG